MLETEIETPDMPVRDLDSAAAYFDKSETSRPANDSTDTSVAGATDEQPAGEAAPEGEGAEPIEKSEKDEDDPTKAPEFKEQPEWARKRMGEISEKKNLLAAEVGTLKTEVQSRDERIADLERQVAGKAPVVVAASPESPLAHIEDPRQLESELNDALNVREWALQHPDGGTFTQADGSTTEVDAEAVKAALAKTDRMINQHIPQRMRFLEQRGTYIEAARTDYPELFKAGTEDHTLYQELRSHWPEINRFLDHEIIAGRYIRGLRAEQAEKAAKKDGKAPAATVKKPATVIAPTAVKQPAPTMPTGEARPDAEKAAARKQATKTGSVDDAARFFSA